MARPVGVEPTTPRSEVWCSIQLSYGRTSFGFSYLYSYVVTLFRGAHLLLTLINKKQLSEELAVNSPATNALTLRDVRSSNSVPQSSLFFGILRVFSCGS